MGKILKWGGIALVILFIIGAVVSNNDKGTSTLANPSPSITSEQKEGSPTAQKELSKLEPTIEMEKTLNHEKLLNIAKESPEDVLENTYEMTLFLEQQPTSIQAEFMSQADDDSMDTLLITCNMQPSDLQKLDGNSAQNRIYKPYNLDVTFKKYNNEVGLYYVADCAIK